MKTSTLINGKNKKYALSAIVILLFSIIGIFLYFYFQQWLCLLLILLGGIIGILIWNYLEGKEKETQKKNEEEWEKFFYDIASLEIKDKETLLKKEMPLSFRLLLERSLSVSVSLNEYQEIGKDLPYSYQCLIESLYFYEKFQSKEEWNFAYHQFLNEQEESKRQLEQKKIQYFRLFPYLLSGLFTLILIIFVMISLRG